MNDKFIEICRYCDEPFGTVHQIYENLFASYWSILWCLTNLSKFVVFKIVDSAIGIILKRWTISFVTMFVLLTFGLILNLNNNNELKRQQPITLTEHDEFIEICRFCDDSSFSTNKFIEVCCYPHMVFYKFIEMIYSNVCSYIQMIEKVLGNYLFYSIDNVNDVWNFKIPI